uniref:Enoyl-CoA hydratase n=1 Tax=Tetradesmus obliquus TaxID=3088 RepID=A0A383V9A1_TETOB|eukprot:jgi/Sobl393_1/15869/SZX62165.1
MRSLQLLSSSALRLGSCLGHSWPWQHAAAAAAASYSAAAAGAAVPEAAIEVTQQGPTALVELNRPKALNALSTQVMHELVDAVMQLDAEPSVRAIIITGRGKAFAAGADIREMAGLDQAQAEQQQLFARWQELSTGRKGWTPLIAAVNGIALGGGAELAMLCDVIIASTAASFGLPEVTLGVIPGIGGTQRLPRLVGRARAMDAMLTARRISAEEALSWGLVSRLVQPEQLLPEAQAIADKLASFSPGAVARLLQASHAADNMPLDAALLEERRLFYSCFGTADQREGMGAFLEKRQPVFTKNKQPI